MAHEQTTQAFDKIMQSSIFRTDGEDIDLSEALIELANSIIHNEPESEGDWLYMGEGLECSCPDLITGAYWALTEWHGGQSSIEYQALSILGTIYNPNMASGPESDSGEQIAYEMLGEWFEKKHAKK